MDLATLAPAVTAIPVGIAFGVVLERAGLGDARVIRGQLVGTDFTVIVVMIGAITTAMLGLLWSDAIGLTSLGAMAMPPTDVGAQVVGAIIFGGGFAIASLCPGTACVAAAAGRRDGLAAVAGVLGGTLVTPLLWPALGTVAASPEERRWLPDDLGVPIWAVAVAVVLFAIISIRLARRQSATATQGPWWRLGGLEVLALTLAFAYAAIENRPTASRAQLASLAAAIAHEDDHVDPVDLARWIREGRSDLRVIDVRDGLDSGTYVIPGAQVVPLSAVASIEASPHSLIVLYSDGGTHAAQAWVLLRMRGFRNVRVLKDGMAAWEDEVLSPVLPAASNDRDRERAASLRELSLWFGGRPRIGVTVTGPVLGPRPRRRNTC